MYQTTFQKYQITINHSPLPAQHLIQRQRPLYKNSCGLPSDYYQKTQLDIEIFAHPNTEGNLFYNGWVVARIDAASGRQ